MRTKPFKGWIHKWRKVRFDVESFREEIPEFTLGYIVTGEPQGSSWKNWLKTSPVIYYDEYTNDIETLNSWYRLVGDEIIVPGASVVFNNRGR